MNTSMASRPSSKTVVEMQKEARKLRTEFESYVEDLRLYSNPAFWKAVANEKKAKRYSNLLEYKKKMGFWMRQPVFTPDFDKALQKLDSSIRKLVLKRIEKTLRNPELGKPLHAPLAGYFSERVLSYRIIYRFSAQTVTFTFLDHRDRVYSKRYWVNVWTFQR